MFKRKGHGLKSFYNTICGFLVFVSVVNFLDTVLFSSYLPAVFHIHLKITDTYKHGTLNLSLLFIFLFTSIMEFHKMESCGDEHFVLEWKLVEL